MKPRTVFFVGKPGCGKGTQAQILAEKTGWPIFASGKLFRDISKEDTAVGRKVKEGNDAGMLQPHWFAMYLYLKSLFTLDGGDAIFDGFNRKVDEAKLVVDSLIWLGRSCSVIYMDISDETVRTRLARREEIEKRADDQVVDERLKEYREFTEPAIELFRELDSFVEVDGEQAPEKIAAQINAALGI